ncbi:hypothetical protein [Aeromicrobium ginsengisoli]|uniref:Uncharacterized protein n=1 Tax=Aeromicrobium ginsengisoli TaxID=363867 RepID=A0A5M4FD30_9ACTN|nr:hypothetical protein [Aeromicrobium ginsengisoli]KAA1395820.1 hypothetical protein ESP70_016930 [Aeromicrobium ginsengisoli]
MVVLVWVIVGVVFVNAVFAVFLVLRFRAEGKRAADARHRREEAAHWVGTTRGSSHRHLA